MVFEKLDRRLYFMMVRYFQFFANRALRRWRPRTIAITGSAGKTTMQNLLEHELGEKAHFSHDANSLFGVSFDILGLEGVRGSRWRWVYLVAVAPLRSLFYRHREEFYVVEIDGERPRMTQILAEWLKPEVTIWVSLGRSHAAQFDRVVENGEFQDLSAAITAEFANLPKNTTKRVYIDGGSKPMRAATRGIAAKVVPFRKTEIRKYVVYPDATDFTYGDTTFHFNQPEPQEVAFDLLVLQDLMKYLRLPFNPDFAGLKVAPGRSSHFKGVKGIDIVDSSYNAHLISMASILDMARRMHAEHKWLVIGDIVEQGSIEEEEHVKLARLIAEVRPEKVILVGQRTKRWTAPELKKLGVSAVATTDPKKALAYIEKHIRGREVLIFKGSQYLEWIIEKLLADPADAQFLCRREKAAMQRKKKRGLE